MRPQDTPSKPKRLEDTHKADTHEGDWRTHKQLDDTLGRRLEDTETTKRHTWRRLGDTLGGHAWRRLGDTHRVALTQQLPPPPPIRGTETPCGDRFQV